ncbi:MAG: hypothetical protein ABS88_19085 [Sphingopyxis sp. SCN 67-31]|nr:MAG: hypothetical protein ABS88_19085 [Sphingopyxis sp. SCN 67-31]
MITCVLKEGASLLLLVPETRARAVQVVPFHAYGTHSLRRIKASTIYKATGSLCAAQILLGQTRIEKTVRYLCIDVEDALTLAKGIEV